MDQIIALAIGPINVALIALAVVAGFLIFAAAVLVIAWAFNGKGRAFKPYAQDVLRDLRDLCRIPELVGWSRRVWRFFGPRLTNRTTWMAVSADIAVAASGQDAWLWIASHPYMALALLALNLFATRSPGTPHAIPAP